MKKYCGIAAVLFVLMLLSSCTKLNRRSQQPVVSSERSVHHFEKIVVNANCDVHFTQGDQLGVKIVGPENTVKNLISECKGSTLTLTHSAKTEWLALGKGRRVDVYVTAPDLIGLRMKGAGDFIVEGPLDTDTLSIDLHGAGDVKIKSLICDEVNASVRGSYDLNIGLLQCSASAFNLYGVGDINIREKNVGNTFIQLRGVGDVCVDFNQCGKATCWLYGVGDMELKGSLRYLDKAVKGTGDIDTEDLLISNR